ncbi:hypothetical protein [Mycobacterium szulgai]|uniref:hypothetical protein n=1 Tax=Mycobacterium szulgai TaxID=1787 RepID=UPI000A1F143C|nr:hypothetical protein [Mycobacterium szulgai]MCV7076978.1 hypothetical protein [Mycobacterium szulgai]
MPDHLRRQRSDECATCGGPIRFYPASLDAAGQEPISSEPWRGAWAHLRRSDWVDNPHTPTPKGP